MRRILSLCDYSGTWSQPYEEAGYDVIRIDIQTDGRDVRLLKRMDNVHGILAAPPCTCFASSGARWKRSDDDMREALSVVDACIRLTWACRPVWWALENPVGKLVRYLGRPRMYFSAVRLWRSVHQADMPLGQFYTSVALACGQDTGCYSDRR